MFEKYSSLNVSCPTATRLKSSYRLEKQHISVKYLILLLSSRMKSRIWLSSNSSIPLVQYDIVLIIVMFINSGHFLHFGGKIVEISTSLSIGFRREMIEPCFLRCNISTKISSCLLFPDSDLILRNLPFKYLIYRNLKKLSIYL